MTSAGVVLAVNSSSSSSSRWCVVHHQPAAGAATRAHGPGALPGGCRRCGSGVVGVVGRVAGLIRVCRIKQISLSAPGVGMDFVVWHLQPLQAAALFACTCG